ALLSFDNWPSYGVTLFALACFHDVANHVVAAIFDALLIHRLEHHVAFFALAGLGDRSSDGVLPLANFGLPHRPIAGDLSLVVNGFALQAVGGHLAVFVYRLTAEPVFLSATHLGLGRRGRQAAERAES